MSSNGKKTELPQEQKISWDQKLGLLLAFIVVVSFLYFVGNPPQEGSFTLPLLRFVAALIAGTSAYLFTGSLHLEGTIPLSKIQIKTTGAFAAFMAVFIFFTLSVSGFQPLEKAVEGIEVNQRFTNSCQGDKEGQNIAALGDNLKVMLENIPDNPQLDKYNIFVLAQVADNPNWYYQGEGEIKGENIISLRNLWDKGDKLHYLVRSVIARKGAFKADLLYPRSELDKVAIKQASSLNFYRDDQCHMQ